MSELVCFQSVESSNVDALGFEPQTQTLFVRFKGRSGTQGPIYKYSPVSELRYEQILNGESVGRAINALKQDAGVDCSRVEVDHG